MIKSPVLFGGHGARAAFDEKASLLRAELTYAVQRAQRVTEPAVGADRGWRRRRRRWLHRRFSISRRQRGGDELGHRATNCGPHHRHVRSGGSHRHRARARSHHGTSKSSLGCVRPKCNLHGHSRSAFRQSPHGNKFIRENNISGIYGIPPFYYR